MIISGEEDEVCNRTRVVGLRTARTALRALKKKVDDLRKAVTKLGDALPDARRDLGSSDPLVRSMERNLRDSRAALRARETPSPPSGDWLFDKGISPPPPPGGA